MDSVFLLSGLHAHNSSMWYCNNRASVPWKRMSFIDQTPTSSSCWCTYEYGLAACSCLRASAYAILHLLHFRIKRTGLCQRKGQARPGQKSTFPFNDCPGKVGLAWFWSSQETQKVIRSERYRIVRSGWCEPRIVTLLPDSVVTGAAVECVSDKQLPHWDGGRTTRWVNRPWRTSEDGAMIEYVQLPRTEYGARVHAALWPLVGSLPQQVYVVITWRGEFFFPVFSQDLMTHWDECTNTKKERYVNTRPRRKKSQKSLPAHVFRMTYRTMT